MPLLSDGSALVWIAFTTTARTPASVSVVPFEYASSVDAAYCTSVLTGCFFLSV